MTNQCTQHNYKGCQECCCTCPHNHVNKLDMSSDRITAGTIKLHTTHNCKPTQRSGAAAGW